MRPDTIQGVLAHKGPFVTIHAEVGRTTEDARQQLDARWTTIRHRLEHEGLDDELVARIEERIREKPPASGAARRTIVAADGEVVLDQVQLGETSRPESIDVGDLPDLSGWLSLADRDLPFALVVADRVGADISFHQGLRTPGAEEDTVDGDDFGITKVPQGDWAQKQFQKSAENQWEENAREVAQAVRSGVRTHPSEVVILAGEERARQEVGRALQEEGLDVVEVESGGRAAGSSDEALWEAVEKVLAEFEAHRQMDLAQRLAQATGQGSGAARGLEQTLDALAAGQVERLLLDPDSLAGSAVDPSAHPGLPVPVAHEVPADRVLVAAAANTGAAVSVMAREQLEGEPVAALLRWDNADA